MSARGLRKCCRCKRKMPVKVTSLSFAGWLCRSLNQCFGSIHPMLATFG